MEYKKSYWYPHLKPNDIAIWERFIEKFPNEYIEVDYDVTVGGGETPPPGTDESLVRDWEYLTSWKIDVVGKTANRIDIIELKPNAGISALGQVMAYTDLFRENFHAEKPIYPVLITDRLRPNMIDLAAKKNIRLLIV